MVADTAGEFMPNENQNEPGRRAEAATGQELPPGVKLLRTLAGHKGAVFGVAFDPQGGMLASGSDDKTVKLWQARSGQLLRTLEGHNGTVVSVVFVSHDKLNFNKCNSSAYAFLPARNKLKLQIEISRCLQKQMYNTELNQTCI